MVPTQINSLGSNEGHGFFGGSKPLKHRGKAHKVLHSKCKNGESYPQG